MIVKTREFPVHARKLQALLRRTSQDHPQYTFIKDSLGRSIAGYKGELQVDYQVSHIPNEDYLIFHDLRLLGRQSYFQIDTLLLSKKLIITLEIKNMSGTLLFDQNIHQLIRVKDGEEDISLNNTLQTSIPSSKDLICNQQNCVKEYTVQAAIISPYKKHMVPGTAHRVKLI